eukprot:11685322-Alexandrium_andersonii.AAC.1
MQLPSPLVLRCRLRGAGTRKREPAPRGPCAGAQLIPTEPAQPWGARRPSVTPAQNGELHVAINRITADGLGEGVGWVPPTRPLSQDE